MIVLYEHPLSPYAQKVKIALYEKGIEFESRLPDLFGGGDEAFAALPELVASGRFTREYRDHRLEWMMRSGGVDIVLDGLEKKNIRFSHELR